MSNRTVNNPLAPSRDFINTPLNLKSRKLKNVCFSVFARSLIYSIVFSRCARLCLAVDLLTRQLLIIKIVLLLKYDTFLNFYRTKKKLL